MTDSHIDDRRVSRRCFTESLAIVPMAVAAACSESLTPVQTVTTPDPVPAPTAMPPSTAATETVELRGPSGVLPAVTATTAGTIATLHVEGTPLATLGGVARSFADVGGIRRYLILSRIAADRVAVLNAACTHEGCTVDRFSAPLFECPCHGSQFDWSGQVRRGPAPAALPRLDVTFDGSVVRILF